MFPKSLKLSNFDIVSDFLFRAQSDRSLCIGTKYGTQSHRHDRTQ
jgi:hypothetical protein